MKEMKLIAGGISRREFVGRAATGGLSVFSTLTALDTEAHGESSNNQATRRHHDHHHAHADQAHQANAQSSAKGDVRARRNPDQTNVNPYEEWLKEVRELVGKDTWLILPRKRLDYLFLPWPSLRLDRFV
ncbi:MAG TPA: hypothetical protein VG324_07000 [Blastocatellia bacterium]|nr:hypothetical protein [Blastocatellia bacterium]